MYNATKAFAQVSGRLPTKTEGLDVLISKPADWPQDVPWEPLLEITVLPVDRWGNPFFYVLDPDLDGGFGIYSCGPDRITFSRGNDRDDINTWNAGMGCYQARIRQASSASRILLFSVGLLPIAAVATLLRLPLGLPHRSRRQDGI